MRNYRNKTFRTNVKHILVFNKGFGGYYFCRPVAEDNHGRCKDMRKLLRRKAKRKENNFYRNIIKEEIDFYNLCEMGYEFDCEIEDFMRKLGYE